MDEVSGAEIQTSAVDTRTAVWVSTAEKFSKSLWEKLGIFLESLGGSQCQLCIKTRPLKISETKTRKNCTAFPSLTIYNSQKKPGFSDFRSERRSANPVARRKKERETTQNVKKKEPNTSAQEARSLTAPSLSREHEPPLTPFDVERLLGLPDKRAWSQTAQKRKNNHHKGDSTKTPMLPRVQEKGLRRVREKPQKRAGPTMPPRKDTKTEGTYGQNKRTKETRQEQRKKKGRTCEGGGWCPVGPAQYLLKKTDKQRHKMSSTKTLRRGERANKQDLTRRELSKRVWEQKTNNQVKRREMQKPTQYVCRASTKVRSYVTSRP